MLIVVVATLGVSGVIASGHTHYVLMFRRAHGAVTNDSYTSRLIFDKICRKARAGTAILDPSGPSLEVWYYSMPNVNGSAYLEPDKFARFYLSGTNLMLSTGDIVSDSDTTTVIARNVTELEFSAPYDGKSVQMVMTLEDNNHSITITCGSIMHN